MMPAVAPISTYYSEKAREEESQWYEREEVDYRKTYSTPRDTDGRRFRIPFKDFDVDVIVINKQVVELVEIRKAVERSKSILRLADDWDDEGAGRYTVSTWERAAHFTIALAKAARDSSLLIGVPAIAPADNGSIDIHWENVERSLLINVPLERSEPATYYGQNRANETTSGLLDTRTARLDLLQWLNTRR